MNRWREVRDDFFAWLRAFPLLTNIGKPGPSLEVIGSSDVPVYTDVAFWSERTHEAEARSLRHLTDAEIDCIIDEVAAVIDENLLRFILSLLTTAGSSLTVIPAVLKMSERRLTASSAISRGQQRSGPSASPRSSLTCLRGMIGGVGRSDGRGSTQRDTSGFCSRPGGRSGEPSVAPDRGGTTAFKVQSLTSRRGR